MKCSIVKIGAMSGRKASVYTIKFGDERESLFAKFVEEYKDSHKSELKELTGRITSMGRKYGIKEGWLKFAGKPDVYSMRDMPKSKLRLYRAYPLFHSKMM